MLSTLRWKKRLILKTNKLDSLNLNFMNLILSEISRCDVILRCGNEKYIGLLYDGSIADSPIVECKGEYDYNCYLMKAGEMLHVPSVEYKLLVREIFDKVEIGDTVPPEYFNVLVTVYSNLEKFKKKDEDHDDGFIDNLNRDLGNQLYNSEKVYYKKVIQKIKRRKKLQQQRYEGDVENLFEEEAIKLSKKYEINIRTYHNSAFKTDEFYFESFINEYNLEFWQIVFISKEDHKIIFGTRHFFKEFDFSEALIVLEVLKTIVDECNTDFRKTAIEYCEENRTNPKLCQLVEDSIRTMLKLNYRETGIEYGFYLDTVISVVYLRPANSSVMYELLIRHRELIKSPQDFKEAIRDPKSINFKKIYCKEVQYDPRELDEEFQKEI